MLSGFFPTSIVQKHKTRIFASTIAGNPRYTPHLRLCQRYADTLTGLNHIDLAMFDRQHRTASANLRVDSAQQSQSLCRLARSSV